MKYLKNEEFAALKQKADNYDAVVAGIVGKNENLKADEVTPEVILGGLEDGGTDNTELTEKITTLESTVGTLTTEKEGLETENAQLKEKVEALSELPGAESVSKGKPASEVTTTSTDTVLEFASKNKGNTLAIVAEMEKSGIL